MRCIGDVGSPGTADECIGQGLTILPTVNTTDFEVGGPRVPRVVIVHDYGQIEGAFVQGLGLYTMEESLWTQDGKLATTGPGTYKIPGFSDAVRKFEQLRDLKICQVFNKM